MHFIDEVLLRYRIRSVSITQSNKVKQLLTVCYIQALHKERKKKGHDSFSEENYKKYLMKNRAFDAAYCERVKQDKLIKDNIDLYKGKPNKSLFRLLLMFRLALFSPFYHKYYIHLVGNKLEMLKIRILSKLKKRVCSRSFFLWISIFICC